jgi:hypothetical protein
MRTLYDKGFNTGVERGSKHKTVMNEMFVPVMLSKDKNQPKTTQENVQL